MKAEVKSFGIKSKSLKITVLVFAILIFGFLISSQWIFSHPSDYSVLSSKNDSTNFLNITGELPPGYVSYLPFVDHNATTKLNLTFISNFPIDVYFVPSDSDYESFMKNLDFRNYKGCFFRNETTHYIDCSVSTGGIVIYNPGEKTTEFDIIGN